MTVSDILQKAQKLSLRTEMEVFLAYLLNCSRLDLIAYGENVIPVTKLAELQSGFVKLMDGMPVAYLTNEKEFYGLSLYVDENVLIPRSESERLVDFALEKARLLIDGGATSVSMIEVGTGSGAISLAVKSVDPNISITATDISDKALVVAKRNAKELGLDIDFREADLLEGLEHSNAQILVANLPYIGTSEHNFIDENVKKYEPDLALFGGENGLEAYSRLFERICIGGFDFQYILCEIGFSQGKDAELLVDKMMRDYSFELINDYQGLDRYFVLEKKAKI